METPFFKENHISQIPASQFLMKLGYEYLKPGEALKLRGDITSGILLEPILWQQLEKLNHIEYKGKCYPFSHSNIQAGI